MGGVSSSTDRNGLGMFIVKEKKKRPGREKQNKTPCGHCCLCADQIRDCEILEHENQKATFHTHSKCIYLALFYCETPCQLQGAKRVNDGTALYLQWLRHKQSVFPVKTNQRISWWQVDKIIGRVKFPPFQPVVLLEWYTQVPCFISQVKAFNVYSP